MPNLQEFERWITTSDAASRLGKSRQGVVWMLENRKLRGVRTPLGWLVEPDAVERLVQSTGQRFVWGDGDIAVKREENQDG